ncbi:hypothetical protein FB45DRAFT_875882 [Roridomyces roridus]|uniref:Uncharacterized protein n=1 Tax=Roridomyces roridus TaxID=1738132 RepID=A0AAD7B4V0_9AGAR|nr:hypothetical protein FB45DRAFT_875882 [Roridomyces roridus]
MSPPVPQELIDLIVGNLAGDAPSLKSCSLTAQAFVRPSQMLLFRSIEILPPTPSHSGDNPCQRFYKQLSSSSHLASYVRQLHIVLKVRVKDQVTANDPSWIMSGRTLSLVLPLLTLNHISLVDKSARETAGWKLNWSRLSRSLRSALTAVFSSPTLRFVQLQWITMRSPRELLSLFCDATSPKWLQLSCVSIDPTHEDESWPQSRAWRPKLTTLSVSEISGDTCTSHFIHPRIDLSGLTKLAILVPRMNGWKFGSDVVPALENLITLILARFSVATDMLGVEKLTTLSVGYMCGEQARNPVWDAFMFNWMQKWSWW